MSDVPIGIAHIGPWQSTKFSTQKFTKRLFKLGVLKFSTLILKHGHPGTRYGLTCTVFHYCTGNCLQPKFSRSWFEKVYLNFLLESKNLVRSHRVPKVRYVGTDHLARGAVSYSCRILRLRQLMAHRDTRH